MTTPSYLVSNTQRQLSPIVYIGGSQYIKTLADHAKPNDHAHFPSVTDIPANVTARFKQTKANVVIDVTSFDDKSLDAAVKYLEALRPENIAFISTDPKERRTFEDRVISAYDRAPNTNETHATVMMFLHSASTTLDEAKTKIRWFMSKPVSDRVEVNSR